MSNLGSIGTSEEQTELLDVATNFCRDKSPIDAVRAQMTSEHGYDADLWNEIAALGWLAIAIPEEYGGVGLSVAEIVPISEQMGRNLLNTPFGSASIAAQALLVGGTEAQKAKWLPKIAGGAVVSLARLEENGDWDISNVAATGTVEGDTVTLSGQKQLVLWAKTAEAIIVSLQIGSQLRFALLEQSDIPDGALRAEKIIDDTARSFEVTLGGISISTDALFDASRTREVAEKISLVSALLHAAEMTGGTQAVIDYTIDYLQTRKQFDKVIGSFQALKHPTVDNYVEYEKARTLLYSAAHCFGDQGSGPVALHMAAAQAHSSYSRAADNAIQFHGAFGFTYDCDAQLYRRQAIFKGALTGDAAYHRSKLSALLFD